MLILVAVFGILTSGIAGLSERQSCQEWKMMAAEMQSDSMMQRTCWSNGTEPCTRVDCRLTMDLEPLGNLAITQDINKQLAGCFGVILNHCASPISMDIYLQDPYHNLSFSYRVYDSSIFIIPQLSYTKHSASKVQVYVFIDLHRINDTAMISVKSKVKLMMGTFEYWPKLLEHDLIPTMTVSLPPCTSVLQQNGTIPTIDQCYPLPMTNKESQLTPKIGSYAKKCSQTDSCHGDHWLMCDEAEDMCMCTPEYDDVGTGCLPISRFGVECFDDDNCAVDLNERCGDDGRCSCRNRYSFIQDRHVCQLHNESSAEPMSTLMPSTSARRQKMVAGVVGGVVGGLAVLVAAGILVAFVIRRRRRGIDDDDTQQIVM